MVTACSCAGANTLPVQRGRGSPTVQRRVYHGYVVPMKSGSPPLWNRNAALARHPFMNPFMGRPSAVGLAQLRGSAYLTYREHQRAIELLQCLYTPETLQNALTENDLDIMCFGKSLVWHAVTRFGSNPFTARILETLLKAGFVIDVSEFKGSPIHYLLNFHSPINEYTLEKFKSVLNIILKHEQEVNVRVSSLQILDSNNHTPLDIVMFVPNERTNDEFLTFIYREALIDTLVRNGAIVEGYHLERALFEKNTKLFNKLYAYASKDIQEIYFLHEVSNFKTHVVKPKV